MADKGFAWPQKGDRLFVDGGDGWESAYLPRGRRSWRHYAYSYKIAGDVLVQHVIDTRSCQEELVYPIVFLYRHYLELELKGLFALSKVIHNESVSIPSKHSLTPLFSEVRRAVKSVWPKAPKDDLKAVEAHLREFEEYDPKSDAFRYPVDTEGNPALPASLERIDLRHLAEIVDGIFNLPQVQDLSAPLLLRAAADHGWLRRKSPPLGTFRVHLI